MAVEKRSGLRLGEPGELGVGQGGGQRLLDALLLLGGAAAGPGGGGMNDGSAPARRRQQSVVGQFAVGPRDGVQVDAQVVGQLPDGRQFVAFAKLAAGDQVPQLGDQLIVQGDRTVERDGDHRLIVSHNDTKASLEGAGPLPILRGGQTHYPDPMAAIGKRNHLAVVRETSSGLYLDGGELGEILLPGRYAPRQIAAGEKLDVFIYRDSEDRLVATTEKPHAMVGEFACMKVKEINPRIGAFLDWGLSKDLLLPFSEQGGPVQAGQSIVVVLVSEISRLRRVLD